MQLNFFSARKHRKSSIDPQKPSDDCQLFLLITPRPVILSSHSIQFHSTKKNLAEKDRLLSKPLIRTAIAMLSKNSQSLSKTRSNFMGRSIILAENAHKTIRILTTHKNSTRFLLGITSHTAIKSWEVSDRVVLDRSVRPSTTIDRRKWRSKSWKMTTK